MSAKNTYNALSYHGMNALGTGTLNLRYQNYWRKRQGTTRLNSGRLNAPVNTIKPQCLERE